jgi:glutamyl-tRNA reductase
MKIHLWGTDFRRSSGDFRKRLCLPAEERESRMKELLALGFSDLVYLWTCNRVEFYTTAPDHFVDTKRLWMKLLQALGLPEDAYYQGYHFEGKAALRHVTRVASSLESLVVGEPQILGQLKESVAWSKRHGIPIESSLDRAFQLAFETAKRVRTETRIAERPVSVASLGLRHFEQKEKELPAKRIVVVGRGVISQGIVEWFGKNRPEVPILWVNRRPELLPVVLENLSHGAKENIEIGSLNQFLESPGEFTHLFTATGSLEPIFTRSFIETRSKACLLFDFGEPPDIEKISSCHVRIIGLEDLRAEAEENSLLRKEAIEAAERIVEDSLKTYFLEQKEAPILKEFSRVEETLSELLEETFLFIENEFPQELHSPLKKMAEKLVKKHLHHSREHLRLILRDVSQSDPRQKHAV